jgi:hypothetical protein
VESHVADAEFGLFAIGDVTGDAHRADDVAALVVEGDFSGMHPVLAAVRPGFFFLHADKRLTCAENLLLVGQSAIRVLGAEEVGIGFVDGLARIGKSKVIGHGPADLQETAGAILKEDVVWDVVEEGFEQRPLHLKSPINKGLVRDKSDDHQQDGENGSHADAGRGSANRVVGDEAQRQQHSQKGCQDGDDRAGYTRDLPITLHKCCSTPARESGVAM